MSERARGRESERARKRERKGRVALSHSRTLALSARSALCALLGALCALLAGCRQPAVQLAVGRPGGPRIQATTMLIRTNLLPEQKAFHHLVILADGKARIGNELDRWRLLNLQNNTVTFVDEIARTSRTETFSTLLRQKRQQLRRRLPEPVPAAEFENTDHQRSFDSFDAVLSMIRRGGYQRSLWMSTNLPVPAELFPLMVVSDPLDSPYAPVMAEVFEGMLKLQGFPVIDRSDITYGGEARVVEKRLVRVEERMVPASWLQVPPGVEDLTPKAADRRPPLRRALERLTRLKTKLKIEN